MAITPSLSTAVPAYIALGSNLGNPVHNIQQAIARLAEHVDVAACSALYHSAPVGYSEQDWFVNAVVAVSTLHTPRELLAILMLIEQQFGRVRTIANGPRTLDLDLLLYGDGNACEMTSDELTLPHPRMHQRAFVLVPLLDIDRNITVPKLGAMHTYLAQTIDPMPVKLDIDPLNH